MRAGVLRTACGIDPRKTYETVSLSIDARVTGAEEYAFQSGQSLPYLFNILSRIPSNHHNHPLHPPGGPQDVSRGGQGKGAPLLERDSGMPCRHGPHGMVG